MHPSSCILTSANILTISSQQRRGEGEGLRGEGGDDRGHEPGVDHGGGDGPRPEQHLVALRLDLGEGGGEGDGAGDQAGGGPGGPPPGQGAGHPAHLGHGGQHGVDQGGHQLRVTPEQPQCAGHQGRAGPHHGAR